MDIRFSMTLANHLLSKNSQNSNVVFCPPSLHAVLGMIAAGSKGQTLDQLLALLNTNTIDDLNALSSQLVSSVFADGSQNGGPHLSYANGVWVDETFPLKPSFKHVMDRVYNATSNQVDFWTKADKVAEEVNLWAEKHTNGLIKEILPASAVNTNTSLIFANAVYFKGTWVDKFDPSITEDYDFHLLNGTKIQTPFMTTYNKNQHMGIYNGFKVLGLPYLQGEEEEDDRCFTLYVFLPNAKDGLPSLIQKIGSKSDFLERHLPNQTPEARRVLIPKFKILFAFEASKILKELGLVLPFSCGEGLTEMVEGGKLYVSSIHHKCFVEVNEEGTEAAAVSGDDIFICDTDNEVEFVADHPFLFVIREDTSGVVLFMGQVIDPRDS